MIKRWLHGTIWLKVLFAALIFFGLTERNASLIYAAVAAVWAVLTIRAGLREQYWESPIKQAARLWEEVVWSHATWLNRETPDEGVKRLTGPFQEDTWNAGTGSSTVAERFSWLRAHFDSLWRSFTHAMATGRANHSVSTEPSAPHFLPT